MADIKTAREALASVIRHNNGRTYSVAVDQYARQALCALDGDGAEEWWASGKDVRAGFNGARVASCYSDGDARRIARLPALERAAHPFECVASYYEGDADESRVPVSLRAVRALNAALKQEGQ